MTTSIPNHAPFCRDKTDGGACWDECCCTVQDGAPYTAGCPLHDLATALEATNRIVAALDSIPPPPGTPTPPLLTAVPPVAPLNDNEMPADVRAVLDQAATVTPLPHSCEDDSHAAGCRCHQGGPVTYDTTADEAPRTSKRARAILELAASLVDGDRNDTYGDAKTQFESTGRMWAEVLGVPVTGEQVALCMALVKINRLITNTGHADSWTDGAGYLALGGGIASQH